MGQLIGQMQKPDSSGSGQHTGVRATLLEGLMPPGRAGLCLHWGEMDP